MGRIDTPLTISNPLAKGKTIHCTAMVDTGSAHLVLPMAWKESLGPFHLETPVTVELGDQSDVQGFICGPLYIEFPGYRPTSGEALFLDMKTVDGVYEILVGFIPLEQANIVVDPVNQRLISGRAIPVKSVA